MAVELNKEFSPEDHIVILRYKGVFDFDGLYKMMHAWLINKRFRFYETKYKDKTFTPFGNELEVDWRAEKKVTEFIEEYIYIKFHLWDFSEIEVIKDGKKRKMTKSRIEITFDPKLKFDYSQKFSGSKSAFVKKLGEFYVNKVLYWEWRIKYSDALVYSVYDLHHKVKNYLSTSTDTNAY